jgi:DNA repair photolyase
MSSTTDPYQPLERRHELTRRCLEVFGEFPDLDLLVVQTRSPLAERDLPLLRALPYAWLSVTIETDDQTYITGLRGGPPLERRWALVRSAADAGIATQITVSPCLPYTTVEQFGARLLGSAARRIVVDTAVDGDGSAGRRTARSPFARAEPRWRETSPARHLLRWLSERRGTEALQLGWSTAGFCGIPPRQLHALCPARAAYP